MPPANYMPHGVYNGEFKDIVDQTFEIAEFDDRQIRQFLGSWEKEMPRDKSINQLMETLHDRPRIMELCKKSVNANNYRLFIL